MPVKLASHNKLTKLFVAGACMITLAAPLAMSTTQIIHAANAYDISEFQGYLTPSQVKRLKKEVSFVVLRVQAGSGYYDRQVNHNIKLMNRYHIPYGVYSYSYYANPAQAKGEAHTLYERAPHAKFYANDIEQDDTSGTLNASTKAWANEIHHETNRPAVLYSGLAFMNENISQASRNKYNAIWLAAYGPEPDPSYHYDLWQFASDQYSRALGKSLDADTFPDGNNKPLSFWIGGSSKRGPSKRKRSTARPLNPASKSAIINAQKAALAKSRKATRYYKNKANSVAKQATNEKNQIIQLENEYNQRGTALQSDTQGLRRDHRKIRRDNNRINNLQKELDALSKGANSGKAYNTNKGKKYLNSKKIHYVRVTAKGGIALYNRRDNKKTGHIPKGAIVHVIKFYTGKHHVVRTVVDYGWNKDGSAKRGVITAKKSLVVPTTYNG